ncbi:MAG: aminomethyltransferase family protein [Bacteroidetes bacterium]|nr:aminomethyltransferase family protein [Bacteroidota bacterium]
MTTVHPDTDAYAAALRGTVFTRFERGVVRATGADRLDLLHRLSTNATRDLAPGEETTTILTSDKGRVVEVVRVLAFDDHLLLLLSGTATEQVRAWLDKYTIMDDFTTADATGEYAVFGVYGERAKGLVARALAVDVPDAGAIGRGAHGSVVVRDARLTGSGGFLVIVPANAAPDVAASLEAEGAGSIDAGTYDVLRTEAGIPMVGRELSESYNPLEAGLSQFISWTKGCYIGQEVIARLDTYDKVQRHLIGIVIDGGVESAGDELLEVRSREDGKKIGTVTSLAFSPAIGATIGMAYVRTSFAVPGARVAIAPAVEGSSAIGTATLTKLPFDR